MKIIVIGTGYVGLVSGGVWLTWTTPMLCFDIDQNKL